MKVFLPGFFCFVLFLSCQYMFRHVEPQIGFVELKDTKTIKTGKDFHYKY